MGWLEGEVALITGGASGLGRAIVERFIEEGAKVAVLDRNAAALDAMRAVFGGSLAVVQGDVTSAADNRAAVEAAISAFGKLDVFVGNAGIWDYNTQIADIPADAVGPAFDEVMSVNVKGQMLGVHAALPALAASGGRIVLTLSNSAFYAGGGGVFYTASKHASLGFLKELAFELAPVVRVNGVAPGALASDLRGPAALGLAETSMAQVPLADIVSKTLPLERLPATEEYAGAYVLLASRRDSGPATGTVINIDGGIGVQGIGVRNMGGGLLDRLAKREGK